MRELKHGGDIYSSRNIPGDKRLMDFSANINPLGLPSGVKKAIAENPEEFGCYPDPLCRSLIHAIAKKEKVPEEYILCGNGAADLIYRLTAALKPKSALVTAPSFSEYEDAVREAGGHMNYFYLSEARDFKLDERILKDINPGLDLMFLCNPNNPTGAPVPVDLVCRIAESCKETGTVLAVDECFVDFLEEPEKYSMVNRIGEYNHLVVIKAFTKIYAMAGIRLGYSICSNPGLNELLGRTGQPWSVSSVAQKSGIAALKEEDYLTQTKKIIKEGREYLAARLQDIGFKVYPGKANYLLFRCPHKNLDEELEKFGILIRSCRNYRGLEQDCYYRIAVKGQAENEYLVNCLRELEGHASP